MVELLVTLLLALDNLNSLLLVGFLHADLFEESGKLLVLLNVLGVSVDGCCAHHLQHVLGEQPLQVGQNTVEYRLLILHAVEVLNHQYRLRLSKQVLSNLLEAVLDLALVTHTLTQSDKVELIRLHVLQRRRNLLIAHTLHDAIDQTGLADARLTHDEQVGTVLTSKDLDDGENLLVETDDGSLSHFHQHRDAIVISTRSTCCCAATT